MRYRNRKTGYVIDIRSENMESDVWEKLDKPVSPVQVSEPKRKTKKKKQEVVDDE